jgi:energy-coupling factor transport system substrate-specific component
VRYRTIDLVTITTLGVAFGVVFWGWDKAYASVSTLAIFSYPPSAGLLGGPWLIAGVVGGLVVRRPGAALATELVAASVEALVPGGSQWGFSTLTSGFWEGLGAELVLAVLLYRRFGVVAAAAAGIAAGVLESIYEWHSYYSSWQLPYRLAHLGMFALSGLVVAGLGGFALTRSLARTGALDAFGPGREAAEEI